MIFFTVIFSKFNSSRKVQENPEAAIRGVL